MATIVFMPFHWASDLNPTFALARKLRNRGLPDGPPRSLFFQHADLRRGFDGAAVPLGIDTRSRAALPAADVVRVEEVVFVSPPLCRGLEHLRRPQGAGT